MTLPFHHLVLMGTPVSWDRARHWKGRMLTPERYRRWKRVAELELQAQWRRDRLAGPLILAIDAYWPRPKSLTGAARVPRVARPDADNIAKAVMDAGTGILFGDDAQVVELRVSKWYAARGSLARIELLLAEASAAKPLYSHCGAGAEASQ